MQVANVAPTITAARRSELGRGRQPLLRPRHLQRPGHGQPLDGLGQLGRQHAGRDVLDHRQRRRHGPRVGPKSHTYADGPNDYTVTVTVTDKNSGSDTETLLRARQQRGADGRDQRQRQRQRGLGLQPHSGCGHRSGRRHGLQLRRALGRRQHRHLRQNGAKTHTYADGPNDYAITRRPGRRGRHLHRRQHPGPVPGPRQQRRSHGRDQRQPQRQRGLGLQPDAGAVTDPGADTVSSYVVHWGDGNTDTYASNGAKTHTYADGPNDYTITVDLVDEDGTFTAPTPRPRSRSTSTTSRPRSRSAATPTSTRARVTA